MKFYKYSYLAILAVSLALGSCKKSAFVELNTDPGVLYSIKPEEQFLNAAIQAHGQDFEQFYDNYRRIMFWTQQSTANAGNGSVTLKTVGNFNSRYGVFYPTLGSVLTDVQVLISKLPDAEKPKYDQINAIADIPKIYYAFYVSDINGSLPYTEAFQARYGGTLTPKYETQQELYALWDKRLKEVIALLKAPPATAQVSLGKNDLYFHGDVALWAKAASALRLRMAMRLMKRDEATATAIVKEVIADASNLMTSNAEGWVFYADVSFTAGGNWAPDEFRAPKPTVDFMFAQSDPRLRLFYKKNNYTQANMNAAIAKGLYPAGTIVSARQYVGAPVSPDVVKTVSSWFVQKKVDDNLALDTVSYLQWRMFQPANGGGTGKNFFPLISYADELFMRAELAAKGITTEDAQALYYAGIDASISFYDKAAADAKLEDYTAVTAGELTAYKASPAIMYSAPKALEQIAIQSYINFFKQPNEAWALYKRTGYPNATTALANENIMIDGTLYQIPRRAAISAPSTSDLNATNKQAALDNMKADPDFGTAIDDLYGRVWWDKK
ncbi:SusD/RagB family nutrient-binding outer membrane lipoprotein [Ferruginibacter paludis]|uniref:SusD/RagB family nutrient-binding outer membrane lipoprotein n=1 Tax=Ferruginibacter paludis TaxID=1310417 RepID=UPI0025B407EE|nr:SusD/RagB family nutrient-binding outer membrane lipoprotein [Ferruginibacter paludis]MDN3655565.1 SusD/RagB family nutrient-binding outer membrane lipoprotein [Ferruginibacter paludis]